jgi:hypothetical protein
MKTILEKFAFDTSRNPPEYLFQSFVTDGDYLFHVIDGEVRAQVPGSHVIKYVADRNISQALTSEEQITICELFIGASVAVVESAAQTDTGVTITDEVTRI